MYAEDRPARTLLGYPGEWLHSSMRQEYAGFGLLCSALEHDKSNPDQQLVQTKVM